VVVDREGGGGWGFKVGGWGGVAWVGVRGVVGAVGKGER